MRQLVLSYYRLKYFLIDLRYDNPITKYLYKLQTEVQDERFKKRSELYAKGLIDGYRQSNIEIPKPE